jgi:MFS family permease
LWHNRAFTRLWFATVVSSAGTQITNLALPLTAAVTLGATPTQMGLLAAAGSLPNLLFGLLAGVWVDRNQRMPALVWADLGRAILLASIPLAVQAGALTLVQLWLVAFVTSTLSIVYTIASVAVLPAIVQQHELVEANSRFALADSIISLGAPGVAGGLIQALSAPRAIALDAASYLLSALALRRIRLREQPAQRGTTRQPIWPDIKDGLRALVETPLLRALTLSSMVGTVGFSVQGAVSILFLTRELHMGAALIGLLTACGGAGALAGALLAGRMGRRLGAGVALVLGNAVWVGASFFTPLAGVAGSALPLLVAGATLAGCGATIFSVNQMSLRQRLTPAAILGRVTAARRFLIFSLAPLGSLLGGVGGSLFGLRAVLIAGGCIGILSVVLAWRSPVWGVRAQLGEDGTG